MSDPLHTSCVTECLIFTCVQSDLFHAHSVKQTVLKRHGKWTQMVMERIFLENAHAKAVESHGKPLSLFRALSEPNCTDVPCNANSIVKLNRSIQISARCT